MGLDAFAAVCCAIPVLLSLLVVRVAYVLCRSGLPPSKPHAAGLRCLIVLGSGGHTAEMMNILTEIQKDRFTPRYYVAALTDNMSLQKAQVYEKSLIQVEVNYVAKWIMIFLRVIPGGHTAEMMNILTEIQKDRFTPRYYVAALTDNMSLQKAQVYEKSLIQVEGDREKIIEDAKFMRIYRSREVGQSYITSIGTTLLAVLHAMWLIIRIRPQVIFCNGPRTCIPLCASAFILKVLGLGWSSIFYIESIARVKKLSLSGLLLYKLRLADQFFVQWPQLQQKYPRAQCAGRLM
ncbi:hypothetical protein ACQ4PT_017667 [Festuca glaucescens]